MPEWTNSASSPTRIGFLLFDRFSNLCLANCIEPLRAANTLGPGAFFDWTVISLDGGPTRSSSDIEMIARCSLSQMPKVDYLFVLASYGHEAHDTPMTRRGLREAARQTNRMVGLDAGPWLLAAAGLLDGKRATVHWDLLDAFTERFLAVEAERAHVLSDGSVITCAGAMSALDLTLDLIAQHLGMSVRLDVEALFLQGDPPVGGSRTAQVTDPLVRKGLQLMRDTIENPISVQQLAQRLSCQPRTLDRRFRSRLGAPPGKVYRHLRLAAARKFIEDSNLGIAEIAVRCGYDSPAAMTRAIKRQYGTTPRDLRRH
ncbi:AraC family transcriptional regulator [Roseovarius atlanticus]|uniref:AraC family transcriptional regulator n=1 Tax=Roseovarius atlanticus TaxID=1641875 RepID=A0A0T5NWA0_9RHOB|nr:GlxA family transcriptional regulator [Roseovarius atlanticus]KRS13192.1 AraC family transcriptional regulator [Roseovarius atlanticus]